MNGSEMVSRNEAPPVALWVISLVALAPFPLSALAYSWGAPATTALALSILLTWSAVVLSFLGGVRWGLETAMNAPRPGRQLISVLSAVAAWGLLIARHRAPDEWVLSGAIIAFLLQWLFDHQGPDVPARYPKLSTAVTTAACVSLALCLDQALRR